MLAALRWGLLPVSRESICEAFSAHWLTYPAHVSSQSGRRICLVGTFVCSFGVPLFPKLNQWTRVHYVDIYLPMIQKLSTSIVFPQSREGRRHSSVRKRARHTQSAEAWTTTTQISFSAHLGRLQSPRISGTARNRHRATSWCENQRRIRASCRDTALSAQTQGRSHEGERR